MAQQGESTERHKRLEAYLKQKGMRKTPERFTILSAIEGIDGHFDAARLHEALESLPFHVSRSTLYSTLDLLVRSGILACHRFEAAESTYEVAGDSHLHLVCNVCGAIEERDLGDFPELQLPEEFNGFSPSRYAIEVFGTCSRCRNENQPKEP